jgi:hypothetical protein
MVTATSRLKPPHEKWFEDLKKTVRALDNQREIVQDVLAVNDVELQLSRASTRMRGALLGLAAAAATIMFIVAALVLLPFFGSFWADNPILAVFNIVLVLGAFSLCFWAIRAELRTPRDEPIRFNRRNGKVYVNTFKFTHNPFGVWPSEIKIFNWADLQGELIRYVQFNSRFFVMRYGLEAAVCRPGTLEVIDRFWIELNQPMPDMLREKWSYVCAFMNGSPMDQLPKASLVDPSVTWVSSFRTYLPWITDWRSYLAHPVLTVMALLMLPFTPFFLMLVVGHYIAMRFAPPVEWPKEIDEACGIVAGMSPPAPMLTSAPTAKPEPLTPKEQAEVDWQMERKAQTRKSLIFVVIFCAVIGLVVLARSIL